MIGMFINMFRLLIVHLAKTVLKEAKVSVTPYISFESEVVAVDAKPNLSG